MGIFSRYVCRRNWFNMNPLINVVCRRGYIADDNNLGLLLQRRDANGADYFTALSSEEGENLSPKYNHLYPPSVETDIPWTSNYVESSISCNGVLSLDYGGGKVLLWNPTTNNYKLLPHTSPSHERQRLTFYATCFGFDPTCNDYKMLRFFAEYNYGDDLEAYPTGDERKDHVEVYSLKNDLWKDLPLPWHYLPRNRQSSVLINGYYYWSCEYRKCGVAAHILCYDFAKEEFSILPIPDIGSNSKGWYRFEILEFDGFLSAVVYPRLGIQKCFDVWVMMNGSWIKECTVNLSGVERPLGFWRKGQYMFFQGLNYELMVFDRDTGDLNNLQIYGYPHLKDIHIYSDPDRTILMLFSHLNNPLPLSDQASSG